MSKTLGFGDDHSAEADVAWGWIAAHRWPDWRLDIVTANPPEGMHPVDPEDAELHPWEPDDPRDASGLDFDASSHLRADVDPRVALISRPWDLVVVGPRGAGMLKTLHLGSTADWLLRQPVSPLVIARQSVPVTRVLVATDGSGHSEQAMRTLASLPWVDGISCQVVTVADPRFDQDEALRGGADVLSAARIDVVETRVLEGRPTRAIAGVIDDTGPDLVVMGARGRGGLKRLVLGSTTAAIAGSVDRSLLVAHAGD